MLCLSCLTLEDGIEDFSVQGWPKGLFISSWDAVLDVFVRFSSHSVFPRSGSHHMIGCRGINQVHQNDASGSHHMIGCRGINQVHQNDVDTL